MAIWHIGKNPCVLHVDELLERVGGELADRLQAGGGAHELQCLARGVGVRGRDGRVAGRASPEHLANVRHHSLRNEHLQRAAVARLQHASTSAELELHLKVLCRRTYAKMLAFSEQMYSYSFVISLHSKVSFRITKDTLRR